MLKYEPGRVLAAAHRGVSGANIPCNSKTAFAIALAQGADIIELDVARSKDGELFVFHPGMEKPHLHLDCSLAELTAKEIAQLRFVNQDGVPTSYCVEKFEDIMSMLKGKAHVNVDKYWLNIEQISKAIRNLGMEDQVIVKVPASKDYVDEVAKYAPDLPLMTVTKRQDEITDYAVEKGTNYLGVEAIFETDEDEIVSDAYIEKMHKQGFLLFGNAIVYNEKRNISAGHTDDIALAGNPDMGWGWFQDKKFDIVQTDWCIMMKNYYKERENGYR